MGWVVAVMILFCITTSSDLMIQTLIEQHNRNEVLVVTPYQYIKTNIDRLDIPCILLRQQNIEIEEADRVFAKTMMPGWYMKDAVFTGTSLGIADVISLDRLKFWFDYSSDENIEFIESLNYDETYVSLDLDSIYPLLVGGYAYDVVDEEAIRIKNTAVVTNSIRTPEFIGYAKHLDFDEYLVGSQEDASFLEKTVEKAKIIVRKLENDGKKGVEYPKKGELRKAMGISELEHLAAVFFDKRDEWQCRRFLSELDSKAWVFPVDDRARELAPTVLWQYDNMINIKTDIKSISACDQIISFRWDDRYFGNLPMELTIIDYFGFNRAEDLAPEGVKVIS